MRSNIPVGWGIILGCSLAAGCAHSGASTVKPSLASVSEPTQEVVVASTLTPTEVTVPETVPAPETPVASEAEPAQKVIQPVSIEIPDVGAREEPIQRRSYADITAKPCFAHAPDYSSLTGELQYLHSEKAWQLRYSSVEEDDRYGGSVILTNAGPMDNYQSGQCVKVEGLLTSSGAHQSNPPFRVDSIQVVAHP